MKLTRLQRYFLSILSGILLTLAFPYTGSLTPLIFIGLVPLLLVEHDIATNRYKASKLFLHAYITFVIYNVGTTWWIWNADPAGASMAFFLNALLMAIAFQLYYFSKKHLGKKWSFVLFVSIWMAFEFLHYHWELSWPWLSFGNVFSVRTTWVQWYELTGVLGGTLWVLVSNFLLLKSALMLINRKKVAISPRKVLAPVIVVLLPIAISLVQYGLYEDSGRTAEVVVVQPNIDPYQKFSTIGPAEQLHLIADIADQIISPNTQLVVAPETAIPVSFDEAVIKYDPGYEILKKRMESWGDVQLYVGASTEKRFEKKVSRATRKDPYGGSGFVEYYNSSILMGLSKNPEIIHKSKLVLGAEKVPFSNWFPMLEELSLDLGGSSGTLGVEDKPKNLKAAHFAFTPSICYESIYGEHTAQQTKLGSEAIMIITNDGWWGDTPGYKQHFSFARLRAIENRKAVARSANTGTSGFINSKGDVTQSSRWWTKAGLKEKVILNQKVTLYMRLGDILGKVSLITAAILVIYSFYLKFFPRKEPKMV